MSSLLIYSMNSAWLLNQTSQWNNWVIDLYIGMYFQFIFGEEIHGYTIISGTLFKGFNRDLDNLLFPPPDILFPFLLQKHYPIELSVMMEMSYSILSNASHMWLLSIWNVTSVTEELCFYFYLILNSFIWLMATVLDSIAAL